MKYQESYKDCTLCPRMCHADRAVRTGLCGMSDNLKVSRAALHFWEEPCISGEEGSGTVFFSGCSLHCSYCQNSEISEGFGKEISVSRLSDIFLELQEKRANNINLVTPTHFAPHIIHAVKDAKAKGLILPVVYNTGGYETGEAIKSLEGTVDIFLTDFKYMDSSLAKKYSDAEDYPKTAKKALSEMFRIIGKPVFDERGIMKKGIIVRHLVLPGYSADSRKIIEYVYNTYGEDVILSIMNQYTPMGGCDLTDVLSGQEYDGVVEFAEKLGIENAYIQEGETAKESFIPPFDLTGV